MREKEPTPTDCGPPDVVTGVLAEYSGPEALLAAAVEVRKAGFTRWDAHSPFPIHGMERAMGIRPTILPWLVLAAGLGGAAAALALQWWTNAFDYPHLVSGKPFWSLPANIPITFELIVLASALAAFGGALVLNLLPQFHHMVFASRRFARATNDGFFLSIQADDPRFDASAAAALLESLGATVVEVCRAPASRAGFPKALYWAGALALVLAPLPLLWIARTREVPSATPRLNIISDMDFQARYGPQDASPLFDDGRAARLPVPGAIADGQWEDDEHYFTGRIHGQFAATFPRPVTARMMQRGRERYEIFCATCHGLSGDRDGMTNLRAQKRADPTWVLPPVLFDPPVRDQPVGQIFHTITHGVRKEQDVQKGAPASMPAYASQIPVEDRWAIVLYVRALQRSQNASPRDVPKQTQAQLQ